MRYSYLALALLVGCTTTIGKGNKSGVGSRVGGDRDGMSPAPVPAESARASVPTTYAVEVLDPADLRRLLGVKVRAVSQTFEAAEASADPSGLVRLSLPVAAQYVAYWEVSLADGRAFRVGRPALFPAIPGTGLDRIVIMAPPPPGRAAPTPAPTPTGTVEELLRQHREAVDRGDMVEANRLMDEIRAWLGGTE